MKRLFILAVLCLLALATVVEATGPVFVPVRARVPGRLLPRRVFVPVAAPVFAPARPRFFAPVPVQFAPVYSPSFAPVYVPSAPVFVGYDRFGRPVFGR